MRRSVTFWSGLFVLAFLLWAWWDSGRNYTYAEFSRPNWTIGCYGGDGMLRGVINTAPDAYLTPGFQIGRKDFGFMGKRENWKVTPGVLSIDLQAPFREIRTAGWLLLIPFFNLWVFLLLWRYLRLKKIEETMRRADEEKPSRVLPWM